MNIKKVLILGGEGNGSVIGFALQDAFARKASDLEFTGYVNDRDNAKEIEGYPVVGGLKDIPDLIRQGYYFISAIGKIGVMKERIELMETLGIPDESFATFVHPSAYVAPAAELGPGCVIMPNASIPAGAKIGKC